MTVVTVYLVPLLLPWGDIPQYPHVVAAPKMRAHRWRIRWYTTGFL